MPYLTCSDGTRVRIDAEDARLCQLTWTRVRRGHSQYAIRHWREAGAKRCEYLHRRIMGAPKGAVVDHINGDGLDCRRSNMRVCFRLGNNRNQRVKRAGTSRFKGVCWVERRQHWIAQICVGYKRHYLGFKSELNAQAAYARASLLHFGDFAAPFVERATVVA